MNMLPHPNIIARDDANKLRQMESYMYQLHEALELALTDIGPENFSAAFRMELSAIGLQMQNVQTNTEQSQQRVEQVNKGQLTVSDVLSSAAYKASIEAVKSKGADGYVKLPDGTMICYGAETIATSITFHESYAAVPVLITSPNVTATVTVSGFTIDTASEFSWIAIGRYNIEEGV